MNPVYTGTKTLNGNLLEFRPGCCGLAQGVVNCDLATAPHGRIGAVTTGLKAGKKARAEIG